MYINQIFELSMVLDSKKFHKVFMKACGNRESMEKAEDEYTDHTLDSKGITVTYRNSQYRKKIKLLVNSGASPKWSITDPDKFIRKLDKRIREYFGFKYNLDDFILSGMAVTADIHAGDSKTVSAYLKVLRRIGRVKGFTPMKYECFNDNTSFCLEGNSNGIEFLLYDLEGVLVKQLKQTDISRKKLESISGKSEGILRAEVRLAKSKAVKAYTKTSDVYGQIAELIRKRREIFMDTFTWIVPFGDFYKKDKAVEMIQRDVKDTRLRRKMVHLVALIPEKKSLYLAQKAMDCRNMEKLMGAFAKINVSPVTISKRHGVKHLKCLYEFMIDGK